jgi:hypothetical protein
VARKTITAIVIDYNISIDYKTCSDYLQESEVQARRSVMRQELTSYLSFYGAAISIIRPAIIIAILTGLWVALQRTDLTSAARTGTWLAVALPLVTWFVFIWNVATAGAFEVRPGALPFLPVAIVLPMIIALPLLTRSQRIAAAIDAAPASWLIGLQVYRVLGANFLFLWAYGGAIPGVFALPAGLGDVLTGLLALPTALYLASGAPHGRTMAIAWNCLGIADLISAVSLGAMTTPGPLQLMAFDQPNLLTSTYPSVMTPAFVVPLSLMLHWASLRQLRRLGQRAGTAASGGHVVSAA